MASSCDVFETGKYQVKNIVVKTSDATKPPTELYIVSPLTKGNYPVLLFCHGFMLPSTWYSDLLHHIASHGYVVVAPKFYGLFPIPIPDAVKKAAQVTEWLSTGLPHVLPQNVEPDTDSLALSGHSRGGKTAFALALAKTGQKKHDKSSVSDDPLQSNKFKALIGIDPVAGFSPSSRPAPKILGYVPRSFKMSIPVAVIGAGLSNRPKGLVPPFAPNGVNHSEFYNESEPPACYFLAKDYGHVDMMDEWVVNVMKYVCQSGKGSKEAMRRATGGVVVAVLRCYLSGDAGALDAIVGDPAIAPITLDPVIYVKE